MIVRIALGDEGVSVHLDDDCDIYSPVRLVEMCNAARKLFFEAYTDTLVGVAVVESDEDEGE